MEPQPTEHLPKQGDGNLLQQPRKTKLIERLLELDGENPIAKKANPILQKYLEEYEKYQKSYVNHLNSIPKKEVQILPDLQPIDSESLYELFLQVFQIVNGKKFNEAHNDYGSRKLARTLLAYFTENKSFYRSPLLNHKSEPNLKKGIAVFGDFGVGKSAIVETFYTIFKTAETNRVMVKDKFGTDQILGRYKLSFGYYTSNAVVQEYEAINRTDKEADKEYKLHLFTKKHHYGFRYYDDIMSERTASNYGKLELFKELFEERYSNRVKTMISLNYHADENGNINLETTLDFYAKKYGERLYDRFFEMFNILELKGESLRK